MTCKIPQRQIANNGDILICTRNGSQRLIGKNVLLEDLSEIVAFGAFMSVYRSPYNEFICHLFDTDSYRKQVQRNLGARINQLTTSYLNEFTFYFPEIAEQQQITDFLSTVDKKIDLLEKKKELLEQYKKGVMQQIFSQKIRFKDEAGNDYPAWKKATIKEVATIMSGGTPDTKRGDYWGDDINWFTPSEVGQKYISKSRRRITELGLASSSAQPLPAGAILLTTRATIGESSIATAESSTNQGFQSLVVKRGNSNEFIYYLMHTLKHELRKIASGSTFLEISKSNLCRIPIMVPERAEQEKMASFLTLIDEKIELERDRIKGNKQFKKALLQRMFI